MYNCVIVFCYLELDVVNVYGVVGFFVVMIVNVFISDGFVVIYDIVIMNIGNIYDMIFGMFIVFFEGIYVFYFYVLSYVDEVGFLLV